MNKIIFCFAFLLGSISLADATEPDQSVDMKTAPTCLFQQFKEAQGNTQPYFMIACGDDIIMTHKVSAFSAVQDKPGYAIFMENALKVMMGSDASITCAQTDSEATLLIVCKR
jgi:hypothetical protein